jgi:hypothetical protein
MKSSPAAPKSQAACLLLIVPRTATLGALISLADMIQVDTLNMTYDVPVKLFAFHLILLSCFLAPDVHQPGQIPVAEPGSGAFHGSATLPQRPGQPDRTCRANHIWSVARRL